MLAALGSDQFGGDANLGSGTPHRSLDQIGGVDFACDQARTHVLALEREGRIAAQHPKEGLQRQRVDKVLGQSVGKILVGAVAEVGKRQHAHDRGSVLGRQVRCAANLRAGALLGLRRFPGPDMDRLGDVLEPVNAGVDQGSSEVLAGLVIGLGGDGHAAGGGDRLEADGDVDTVPEHLVLVGHHIAHVDAKTELHDPIGGQLVVPLRHQHLHPDRRLDRAHDARKFQQETVAGVLHQPAAVIENDRIDRASMRLERGMGAGLVGAHHPRVTRDIGADDCR